MSRGNHADDECKKSRIDKGVLLEGLETTEEEMEAYQSGEKEKYKGRDEDRRGESDLEKGEDNGSLALVQVSKELMGREGRLVESEERQGWEVEEEIIQEILEKKILIG